MTPKTNSLYILGAIVAIGLAMWFLGKQPSQNELTPNLNNPSLTTEDKPINLGSDIEGDALLVCDNKKAIGVNLFENGAILNLSDGRTLTLGEINSEGSGAVYVNKGITFVNVGITGPSTLSENGTDTFSNCRQVKAEIE